MPSWKAAGVESLPAEVLKTDHPEIQSLLSQHPCQRLEKRVVSPSNRNMRPSRSFTKRRVVLIVIITGEFLLVAHAGKVLQVLLTIVAPRLSVYRE